MNRQTIGAMNENYDVAMLAGHNVMYYSDGLKGDSVQKSFELHSKVIQNSHFDLSSIILDGVSPSVFRCTSLHVSVTRYRSVMEMQVGQLI